MLRELHINNLAVIEDAAIELRPGLNVFTGQTGAGKSLILGAFELLLGLRGGGESGTQMVRKGAEEARVSGVFELHDEQLAEQIAEQIDQTIHPGDELLITRKLFTSGRSSVSVNGQPATAAMLREVGQLLVDIHGQHDHQFLLKPANQLAILDDFADAAELREQYHQTWRQLRELRKRRDQLQTSGTLRRQQLELYTFQANEIDEAELQPGELPELEARHAMLSNVERIKRETGQVYAALYDSDGAVVERLQMMAQVLIDLAELDEQGLGETAEQIREATLSLQEAAYSLNRYVDRLELNPSELSEIEERVNLINRLVHKYARDHVGDDAAASVLTYREQLQQEIDQLQGDESDFSQMDQQAAKLQKTLEQLGSQLSETRQTAAKKLKPLVEAQLSELGMAEATFDVIFKTVSSEDEEAGPSGLDQVEFLIQPNPGQDPRPLRKIASGGELSRVMLGLKSIFAGSDRISVLVFDEIDANIGGRLGSVIGRKLRALAENDPTDNAHQVLCITHLPQIAAFGHRHLRISKSIEGKGKQRTTRTTVETMEDARRIDELAEMISGKDITATTRKQAKELLKAAGVKT